VAQDVIITLSAPQHVGARQLHAVDTCETGCTGEWIAEEVKIAYGGVAPKTIMAPKVHAALKGQPWTGETLNNALEAVAQDVNITPNAPGTDPASFIPHRRYCLHLAGLSGSRPGRSGPRRVSLFLRILSVHLMMLTSVFLAAPCGSGSAIVLNAPRGVTAFPTLCLAL